MHFNHHVVSSSHHNFTIKKPRLALAFFKTPFKNRLKKTTKTTHSGGPKNIHEKTGLG
jgi:hypothetical protein